MMLHNLIRGEVIKIRHQPALRRMAAISAILLFIAFVSLVIAAKYSPDEYITFARETLPFPNSFRVVNDFMGSWGLVVTTIFMSYIIGVEYKGSTLKTILPRVHSRSLILAAKLLTTIGSIFVVYVVATIFGVFMGWIGTQLLNLDAIGVENTLDQTTWQGNVVYALLTCVTMIVYGSIVFTATIGTRSITMGILGPLILLWVVQFVASVFTLANYILPSTYINVLLAHWGLEEQTVFFEPRLIEHPNISWLGLLLIIATSISISIWIFSKQSINSDG